VEQVHSLFEGIPTRRSEVAVLSQPGFGTVEAIWLDPEIAAEMDELAGIVKHVREGVGLLSGTVVVQRCPTALKDRVNVWGAEPSGIGIMRRLKEQYDPNNILNPGRFVGRL
jgi:glycolate oxidase FAD binding subunit